MVVNEGYLVRDGLLIKDASSSVTLVESSGELMLVDTGSPKECRALTLVIKAYGVSADSIRHLVNTHLHLDHVGCNHLFRNARMYAHALELPPLGTTRIIDSLTILPDVEVISTPGHTYGCVTVLVNGDERYALCGDAIPTEENYLKHVPPLINVNPVLALMSMDAIARSADVIVPGHGAPFHVRKK